MRLEQARRDGFTPIGIVMHWPGASTSRTGNPTSAAYAIGWRERPILSAAARDLADGYHFCEKLAPASAAASA